MTGKYCGQCGAQTSPGASFCASCGAALASPAAVPPGPVNVAGPPAPGAPTAPVQPAYPAQQPAYNGHPPVHAGHPGQYAGPPAYPGRAPQPQYAAAPQQPWGGAAPYPGTAQQPAPPPWATAVGTAPGQPGVPRRSLIDSLLTGDWGGAARSAGLAVGAMLVVSLVGMLLISQGELGFHETLALVLAGLCLAVGGDAFVEADAQGFGASASLGVLPLTITFVGLGLLGWSSARQLRHRPPASPTDGLLHGVRTVLVFTACFLPVSLLTRYENDEVNAFDLSGQLGVGVVSSVLGAFLFAVAALGLTWFLRRSTPLPARVAAFRDKALAPLVGAVAVFAFGLLAVLGLLVYGLVEESDKAIQLGLALIGAGNGALLSVLWSAGVPLDMDGSASTPISEFAPSGSGSVDLLTFTDASAWFWFAPVVLLAGMVLVTTALAVRQNTVEDARREGARFAGALALIAFAATLLLRVGFQGEASEFGSAADGSLMFNPFLAAVVLGIWGIVTGLLAPVVAAKVPSGFVTGVRRRFGAAADLVPPVG